MPNKTVDLVHPDPSQRAYLSHAMAPHGLHCEVYESIDEYSSARSRHHAACANRPAIFYHCPDRQDALCWLEGQPGMAGGHKILILAENSDYADAVKAIKLGATDYIPMPVAIEALSEAIISASTPSDVAFMASSADQTAQQLIARLSPRERDVLSALADGMANKEIARKLAISPRTVELHRAHMMAKLNAHHIADALRIAFGAGLAPLKTRQPMIA